ncbi:MULTISPECIES: hypothetical protein [unclassified Oceanispirochaeta]|uniref:hypothetical protein n=1 Tax=unclassified Oceanispirochaeta TaxID=2635722 RepID=UPI000E08CEC2|nr:MULTISPECIES: hypothetical protein [unclassified Oceanispirochaeta]MBF9016391.1 hypothetical protein [Oceanispirochaeta sp. M2]NPD72853.1 hypothetical protein [Oceanispirochaeta sp. M1]RDG31697.1 hypothetical protein DV872_12145 [Oceanispirochaeta sp. M1]
MNNFRKIIVCLSVFFTLALLMACDLGSDDPEVFELEGSWLASGVTLTFDQNEMIANLSVIITGTSFENVTEITSPSYYRSTSKGTIEEFNNSEKWYLGQITEAPDNETQVGQYGRTVYTLSSDGLSYTGTSYSIEATRDAAMSSTTVMMSDIVMVKQ